MNEQKNLELEKNENVEVVTENVEDIKNTENEATKKKVKKLNAKQLTIIGAIVTVVIALMVGIGIYNTPENRLNRQLDLGQKYLQEQNYEQAVLAFNEAIAIDDKCLEAYVGGIEAYLQLGNEEELIAFYERALVASESLEGDILFDNMEYICSIYLFANDMYDDTAKRIEVLEKGLAITNDNAEIKKELVNNYVVLAKDYVAKDAFTDGLKVYDRLLELDAHNEQLLGDLSVCLNEYFEILIGAKDYDEVRSLVNKYKQYGLNVDFDDILARVAELERIDAENLAFMEKLFSLMSAEDYIAMMEVDGSDEASGFVKRMESKEFVYIPEDVSNSNGFGVGVYKFGEENEEGLSGYYFYLGNYTNGVRNGQGKSFIESGEGYYRIFNGEWSNNAPNGYGEESEVGARFNNTGEVFSATVSGNLVDGLWDGEVKKIIRVDGYTYDATYSAIKGVPTEDKTQDFINECGYRPDISDEYYIYAYDAIDSTNVYSYIKNNYALGTIGYGGPVE